MAWQEPIILETKGLGLSEQEINMEAFIEDYLSDSILIIETGGDAKGAYLQKYGSRLENAQVLSVSSTQDTADITTIGGPNEYIDAGPRIVVVEVRVFGTIVRHMVSSVKYTVGTYNDAIPGDTMSQQSSTKVLPIQERIMEYLTMKMPKEEALAKMQDLSLSVHTDTGNLMLSLEDASLKLQDMAKTISPVSGAFNAVASSVQGLAAAIGGFPHGQPKTKPAAAKKVKAASSAKPTTPPPSPTPAVPTVIVQLVKHLPRRIRFDD